MNELVMITGAGAGVGLATSLLFAKKNYTVLGLDSNPDGLKNTKATIDQAGGKFISCSVDVSSDSSVSEAFDFASTLNLPITTVVNCAGIAATGLIHEESDDSSWTRHININLTGTYNIAKYAMKCFLKEGSGSFVAISSDAGVRGASGYAAYCASKHGVIGLVRCLALDYGKYGIRSNAICPGFIETAMMDRLFNEADDPQAVKSSYAKEIPLGRFAKALEVAKAIFHLSSSEASYTNGMVYNIDGGATSGHFDG